MFIYTSDLAVERRRLQGLGISLGDDIPGDYSTLAQLRDPDGNLITLATPPIQPFRKYDGKMWLSKIPEVGVTDRTT